MKTIFLKRNIQNRSGQASLEMVLTLVIGMLIALGLIFRFNTAFKKYTTDLYGTYYRCLLEAGELPGLGAVCSDKKTRFDIANGKELVKNTPGSMGTSGGGTGGNGGGAGGGVSGGSSSGKSGSKGKQAGSSGGSGSGDRGGNSGGAGSSETVGGSGRSSGGGAGSVVGRLRNLGKTRSTAVGRVGSDDKEAGDKGSTPQITATSARSSSDGLKAPRTKMNFQMDGDQYRRQESAISTPTTATASSLKAGEKGDALRPRKVAEATDRKPASKLNEDKGGGLEFGRLFRMFIIFGIIVGIVVFLGGQVLQISKSSEK